MLPVLGPVIVEMQIGNLQLLLAARTRAFAFPIEDTKSLRLDGDNVRSGVPRIAKA